jgi:hypothetical protein
LITIVLRKKDLAPQNPPRNAKQGQDPPLPHRAKTRAIAPPFGPVARIRPAPLPEVDQYDMGDAFQERLHTMRTRLITAALLLLTVCAPGQSVSVQQKAAEKTLARKAQADCDAQTARVARTFTAVVKETRVYSVFYSPKYAKCLAAVYLPINKELTAASLVNLDSAGGTQHIVWENLFSKPFDAISELDRQIDKFSK